MKLKICPYPYRVWVSDVTFLVLLLGQEGVSYLILPAQNELKKQLLLSIRLYDCLKPTSPSDRESVSHSVTL